MEVSVEETVLPDTVSTISADSALLQDTIPVVTVGTMPILTDAIATSLAGSTPTILNVPIFSGAAGSGYVIATAPDGTGTVFLDASQVALLTHGATRATTIFDTNLLQFSTADTISHQVTSLPEETVVPQPLLLTQETPSPQTVVPHINAVDDIRPPIGKGPYKCDLCDREFTKWNQLQRHLKQHADDKPHRCDQCDVSYNVKSNLLLHQATHRMSNPECPECGKRFSRIASLKAHIMLHEKEENLMCPECGEEFSTQPYLDKHMQEHCDEILEEKVYPCKLCLQKFSKATFLRDHMKIHYKLKASLSHRVYKRNINRTAFPHKCSTCGKSFQKPSQLVRHNRIHTGERPFKCDECGKAFNQKGALQIHMTKHSGERPHPCEFCPAAFAQKGNLRAHIKRVHTLTKEGSEIMFQCDECACVFKKLGSLNAHISRMHTGEFLPLRDQDDEDDDDAPENGGNPDAKSMKKVIQQLLELSKQTTVTPEQAQQQIQEIAENSNVSADILQQALENSGLASTTPSNENKQNEGKEKTGKNDMAIPVVLTNDGAVSYALRRSVVRKVGGVRWHQCIYCSKEFKKPSDLVRHIRIHTHEKPYKCNQCYRAFAVKSTLTVHVRTHTGIKEFRCEVCKKMFSTQGSLKVHARLHTGAKPFSCTHCDKKFRTSGHRKSHMVSHMRDGIQPKRSKRVQKPQIKETVSLLEIPMQEPILITDAGLVQQAPKRNGLYQEYLDDVGSADRPYKCTYCSRGFKKSSHLKQHVRSHTGEKPYRCVQCCRSFVSNGVLKAHIRTHSGVKAYKCSMCDASFTTNGSRKRHMCTHSEVRPYMCPYCQKTFKTSMTCKKHMKTHRHELVSQGATSGVTVTVVPEAGSETQVDMVTTNPQDLTGHIIGNLTEMADDTQERDSEEPVQITALQTQDAAALTTQTFATQVTLSQENLQQLQQSLNQQVFETQPNLTAELEQATLNSTQATGFDQSQNTFFAQPFSNFPQNQYTLQGDVLDVPNNFTAAPTLMNETLATTSMASILPHQPQDSTHNASLLSLQSAGTENRIVRPLGEIHQIENRERRRSYQCTICDKAFKKSSHLKQHHRTHTGEKPYKCPQCSRMFVSMGVLRSHLKTHTGTKDFQCKICRALFTTNGSLTRHMTIHSCTHPHHCSYCSQTFRTPTSYRRHLKTHHDDNQNLETADDSSKSKKGKANVVKLSEEQAKEIAQQNPDDTTSVSLKVLIASAAEKNRVSEIKDKKAELEKLPKYANQCEHCPKSFKKPSDLVRHVRIHTGEKPYMCEMCAKSFTVKSTLDSHVKTHTGEKSFTCHVCNSQFSTKGSLKVHMRLHTGAKPFKCPHCELRFRTSGHRKSHIISHLKEKNIITEETVAIQEPDSILPNISLQTDPLNAPASTTNAEAVPPQMVESIQVQLTPSVLAQSIQITGIDPSLLSQTVQIDANLLQQLQQHGNINITITPSPLMESLSTTTDAPVTDSGALQGSLSNEGTITAAVNPNIIIHSLGNLGVPLSSEQEIITTDTTTDVRNQDIPKITYNILTPNGKNINLEQITEARQNVESVMNVEEEGTLVLENDAINVESITTDETENIIQNIEFVQPIKEETAASVDSDRIHICNICKKGFKRANHLKEHILIHQSSPSKQSRPTPHQCPHCVKAFSKPSQLERHKRIHTGERPFVCTECNKAFNQKNALQIHKKKHTGERPFACSHCNMAFTQSGNLKMHTLRTHSTPNT